jgi:hypothetical protein
MLLVQNRVPVPDQIPFLSQAGQGSAWCGVRDNSDGTERHGHEPFLMAVA